MKGPVMDLVLTQERWRDEGWVETLNEVGRKCMKKCEELYKGLDEAGRAEVSRILSTRHASRRVTE